MNVEEFLDRMEETNEKILQTIDILREQPAGIKELEKVNVAREYFCDAVLLALKKRLDEGKKKLDKADEILRGIEQERRYSQPKIYPTAEPKVRDVKFGKNEIIEEKESIEQPLSQSLLVHQPTLTESFHQEKERYEIKRKEGEDTLENLGIYLPLIVEYVNKQKRENKVNRECSVNDSDVGNEENYPLPTTEKIKDTRLSGILKEAQNVMVERGAIRYLMEHGFPPQIVTNPLVYMAMRYMELEGVDPFTAVRRAKEELKEMKTQQEGRELVEWATKYFEKINKKLL